MKKLYFIIPLVFAGVFFFFFMNEKNDIAARSQAKQAEVDAERAQKIKLEAEARDRAKAEAQVQSEKRTAEREKKRVEEDRQKVELQAVKEAREQAFYERERQYKQYLRVTEDRTVLQDQLRRAKEQMKLQQAQADFVKNSVNDVRQRRSIYEQALGKLEIAERAAAENEAARFAAAAAVKKSK